MILNDMGMNLLVDSLPAKVTERKHAEEKSGREIKELAVSVIP
jgi:hypothetical protein